MIRPDHRNVTGLCLAIAVSIHGASLAARITLVNGRVAEGPILEQNESRVVIQSGSVRLTLPRSEIEKIEDGSVQTGNVGGRVDTLVATEDYSEALEACLQDGDKNPEAARAQARRILDLWDAKLRGELSDEPTAALERLSKRLLTQIEGGNLSGHELAWAKRRAAHALALVAKNAADKVRYGDERQLLEEAWRLCPDVSGLAPAYIRSIRRSNPTFAAGRVREILLPYLAERPDDLDAIETMVEATWRDDPWRALALVYPGNKALPDAPASIRRFIPSILLACFESQPFPVDAPLDQVACYEHYLRFVPAASPLPLVKLRIARGANPFGPVKQYADWLTANRSHLTAYYAYSVALGYAEKPDVRQLVGKRADAAKSQYLNEVLRDVGRSLKARQFDDAHLKALTALSLFPDDQALLEIKREKTSCLDECFPCSGRGTWDCAICGGDGIAIEYTDMTCPTCRGLGRLTKGNRVYGGFHAGGKVTRSGQCVTCEGRGKMRPGKKGPCKLCNGAKRFSCDECGADGLVKLETPRSDQLPPGSRPVFPAWLVELDTRETTNR